MEQKASDFSSDLALTLEDLGPVTPRAMCGRGKAVFELVKYPLGERLVAPVGGQPRYGRKG
jgi:hypothetical protein